MFDSISPRRAASARRFVTLLCMAAEGLSPAEREKTDARFEYVYGDLSGQRALTSGDAKAFLDVSATDSDVAMSSFILALETYFATVCNFISASAASGEPAPYLRSLSNNKILDIVSGAEHLRLGLRHYENSFELDWYAKHLNGELFGELKTLSIQIASLWEESAIFAEADDPIQMIHDEVFPKNLVHATGQFYTPSWLCDLLLSDLDLDPSSLIIDPFCGSGAFLLAALRALHRAEVPIKQAVQQVFGIDLNPSACIAVRTNLVLHGARHGVRDFSDFSLNVLCADALTPAVAHGQSTNQDLFAKRTQRIMLDGEFVESDPTSRETVIHTATLLSRYGIAVEKWLPHGRDQSGQIAPAATPRDRKIAEQLAVFMLAKADLVLTNPPWVGWEYISRSYRTYLNPAWEAYSLFEQKGLDAAFLKEDLSTLCVPTACDRYLKESGNCAVVVRPAAMQSDLAGRGLRRLSIFADGVHLGLQKVRLFENMQVFGNAAAPAAAWHLTKGQKTSFPVPVVRWFRNVPRWQPDALSQLCEVQERIEETSAVCSPSDPTNYSSRWIIADQDATSLWVKISGRNSLQPRIGFFTGGANAVYYMQVVDDPALSPWKCENITERAKRLVDKVSVKLESDLVFKIARGRDISFWHSTPQVHVLCPHNRASKMYPLSESDMRSQYPLAFSYLKNRANILRARKGFAGWEKRIHDAHFYALQRIGDYTFAPYKVCWSYISNDFTICVVGPDARGKPVFPNDKVVFVAFEDPGSAYFLAGVLSSAPMRQAVVASTSSRQVSGSVVKHLAVPEFDTNNSIHIQIADLCQRGHQAMSDCDTAGAEACYNELNEAVGELYGLTQEELGSCTRALEQRLGFYPFRVRQIGSRKVSRSVA